MPDPFLNSPDDRVDLEPILDVRVDVTVELGRTQMTLREALEIGPGIVVALERTAGAPLALKVNGKLVARGEVLVIDDVYGLHVTETVYAEQTASAAALTLTTEALDEPGRLAA